MDETALERPESPALAQAVQTLADVLEQNTAVDYPWRETHEPYRILIAEMMLVRTRADLVIEPYLALLDRYPMAEDLACATLTDIEPLLAPLGLRKRIPFFVHAAQYIVEHYAGQVPNDRKGLRAIPGMGGYTADAVLAFAFDRPVIPTDVNVLRWIARVTGLAMVHSSKGSRELRDLLPNLAPLGGRKAYKLLDFLRAVCRPRNPLCPQCPIQDHCTHGRKQVHRDSNNRLQP